STRLSAGLISAFGAISDDRRMHRELDHGLRDEGGRIGDDQLAHLGEFLLAGLWSDNDAVTAGRAGRLDDVTTEIGEHFLADLAVAEQICFDDWENRFFGQVVANHRGGESVDR